MYRHIHVEKILSIKYYTEVPLDTFKRWSLPANDNLMRQGDLYKLTYLSIKERGLLDPVLCYDLVNVDVNNPPIYHGRRIWGLYLMYGNIRWLCCKDLGIKYMNAIVAEMDHAQENANFKGTTIPYRTCIELKAAENINNLYIGYSPQANICSNYISLRIPSLTSVALFSVSSDSLAKFNETHLNDYAKIQRVLEGLVN